MTQFPAYSAQEGTSNDYATMNTMSLMGHSQLIVWQLQRLVYRDGLSCQWCEKTNLKT